LRAFQDVRDTNGTLIGVKKRTLTIMLRALRR